MKYTYPQQFDDRLASAIESAHNNFWSTIAERYPEISTGDFCPEEAQELTDKLTEAVKLWLELNY